MSATTTHDSITDLSRLYLASEFGWSRRVVPGTFKRQGSVRVALEFADSSAG